jgi:hypothetical protein
MEKLQGASRTPPKRSHPPRRILNLLNFSPSKREASLKQMTPRRLAYTVATLLQEADGLSAADAAHFLRRTPNLLAKWRVWGIGPRYHKAANGFHVRYNARDLVDFALTHRRKNARIE